MIDLTAMLPKLLRANGANAELAVKLAWSKAAGTGLRRSTIPVRLVAKTLVVAVADPIWQKQLQHMSAELIFRINNLLQGNLIDAAGLKALASMPGLPELRGMLVGMISAPASRLVRLLSTPGGQVARVLKAKSEKAA